MVVVNVSACVSLVVLTAKIVEIVEFNLLNKDNVDIIVIVVEIVVVDHWNYPNIFRRSNYTRYYHYIVYWQHMQILMQ